MKALIVKYKKIILMYNRKIIIINILNMRRFKRILFVN
jgi:hypothetical protein